MEMESETGLDPLLWIAFAGRLVKTFKIGQNVFFFPQGYQEQANGTVDFSRIPSSIQSCIRCKVLSIEYLADHVTDEVYAKIKLIPVPETEPFLVLDHEDGGVDRDNVNKVESFVKTISTTDANNRGGGGFSVPRRCAETIFPKLNIGHEPRQDIKVKDVHNIIWTFCHIYGGTLKKHTLTSGWNRFVDRKELVGGDSIVFAIDKKGELRAGIRRIKNEKKVSPESVIESLNLAIRGQAFEVIYYPRLNAPAFCVDEFRVRRSLDIPWCSGSRCAIEIENKDSCRSNYLINGIITSIKQFDPNQWKSLPWKSIQVTWYDNLEKHLLEKVESVNPWMIELIGNVLSQPTKKQRLDSFTLPPPSPPMFAGGVGQGFVPYKSIPAGMQGARQDPNGSSSSSTVLAEYHPGSVSNAGGSGEVVPAGKEKDKDDSSYFYLLGFRIEKNQSAKSPSEEGNDDDKGDGNEGSEK